MMGIPGAVRPTIQGPAVTKRTGMLRMLAGSDHMLTLRPKDGPAVRAQVKARDRREVLNAKVVFVCLHHACEGKSWPDERAMRMDHPAPHEMDRVQQAHVYGLWSNDLVDPKDKASGVVGLIAPPEPKTDE